MALNLILQLVGFLFLMVLYLNLLEPVQFQAGLRCVISFYRLYDLLLAHVLQLLLFWLRKLLFLLK